MSGVMLVDLTASEIEAVDGGITYAMGLTFAASTLGIAGAAFGCVPGAQVLAAGLGVMSIGVGALANAAADMHI